MGYKRKQKFVQFPAATESWYSVTPHEYSDVFIVTYEAASPSQVPPLAQAYTCILPATMVGDLKNYHFLPYVFTTASYGRKWEITPEG